MKSGRGQDGGLDLGALIQALQGFSPTMQGMGQAGPALARQHQQREYEGSLDGYLGQPTGGPSGGAIGQPGGMKAVDPSRVNEYGGVTQPVFDGQSRSIEQAGFLDDVFTDNRWKAMQKKMKAQNALSAALAQQQGSRQRQHHGRGGGGPDGGGPGRGASAGGPSGGGGPK